MRSATRFCSSSTWIRSDTRFSPSHALCAETHKRLSAILTVKQVPDRLPPLRVCLTFSLALIGIHRRFCSRVGSFFLDAALRTAVGEAGLVRLQFELLFADHADFDWECHCVPNFNENRLRHATELNSVYVLTLCIHRDTSSVAPRSQDAGRRGCTARADHRPGYKAVPSLRLPPV